MGGWEVRCIHLYLKPIYLIIFKYSGSADAESIIRVVCHFVACFGGLSLSRFLNKFGGALAHYRMDLGSARISGV